MRIAYRIPKATNTNSEYVIPIVFPLQQWLHERASLLRYTFTASLVYLNFFVETGKICLDLYLEEISIKRLFLHDDNQAVT
jgi:hypothetical protein